MEWQTKEGLFQETAGAADGPATESGVETGYGPTRSGVSSTADYAGREDIGVPRNSLVSSIRARLDEHPHFRGRSAHLQIDLVDGAIVLSGRLPSHYLKQLLQEAVKGVPDVAEICNCVEVLRPAR